MTTDSPFIAFSRYVVTALHGDRKPVFWVRLTLYTHHTIQADTLARESFSRYGEKDHMSHRVTGSAASGANPITP